MTDWTNTFYHVANPELAAMRLVPEESEQQVMELIDAFQTGLNVAYAPNAGVHGLIFGEWGHGKSQVLYRVAAALASDHDRCACLTIVPEDLSPRGILTAAAISAAKHNLNATVLRDAAHSVTDTDPASPQSTQRAARTLSDWAVSVGKFHTAFLFDEAQTIGGANFQLLLQETRTAFQSARHVLHTLQCHSLVTLDRARQLASDLTWLRGPQVKHIYLGSLDDDQAFSLLCSRVETADPALAETFISSGIARTVCRLAGGNPRKIFYLPNK